MNIKLEDLLLQYISQLDPGIFEKKQIEVADISPLTGGHHNKIYKLELANNRKYIIRFSDRNKEGEDRTAEEYRNIERIKGVAIPKILFIGKPEFLQSSLIITEFIEGEHKAFRHLNNDEIKSLAKNVAHMHQEIDERFSTSLGAKATEEGNFEDYIKSIIQTTIESPLVLVDSQLYTEADTLIRDALARINTEIDQQKEYFAGSKFSLMHTDIGDGNVLWQQNRPIFIDWEDVTFGDPADEIGYIFAINNVLPGFEKLFLEAYLDIAKDETIHRRVPIYKLKNRLFDLVWSIKNLHKGDPYPTYYQERLRALRSDMEM